jgi:hypothetical protein
MRIIIFLLAAALVISCDSGSTESTEEVQTEAAEIPLVQQVVDGAIEASGADRYDNADFQFIFRDMWYRGYRKGGLFSYERKFVEEDDSIHDVYNNDGFTRYINNEAADIPDSMAVKYTNSVNSVLYFVLLPKPLNDEAVIKEYLGETEIKGKTYHKIKVTFRQEGGGEDFTDVYIYWFDKDDYSMDYFAYLYHTDGGGIRFRETINTSTVNGIKFQDYINYKVDDMSIPVETLDSLFLAGELDVLSRIEQTDISVEIFE